jgi:hypothetical protein
VRVVSPLAATVRAPVPRELHQAVAAGGARRAALPGLPSAHLQLRARHTLHQPGAGALRWKGMSHAPCQAQNLDGEASVGGCPCHHFYRRDPWLAVIAQRVLPAGCAFVSIVAPDEGAGCRLSVMVVVVMS